MRKLLSIIVMISMLVCLLPNPAGATLAMHQSLSTADVKITQFGAFGGLGQSVAIVGDVNRDGHDDYMAVDTWNDSFKGNAYLFYGMNDTYPTSASQANTTFYVEGASAPIATVAGIGDVNGDGFDDFMIGSPAADTPATDAGAAYIFFGRANGYGAYKNVSTATAIIRGTAANDGVGAVVAAIGNANGDSRDDFAIGCWGKNSWGVTYLFNGKNNGPQWNTSMNLTHAAASFHGKEAKSLAGWALAGGDVNGDGLDDLIISSPGSSEMADNYKSPGYIYIAYGRTAGWAQNVDLHTQANASLMGEHYDDYAGQSVAVPGDVNDDGYEDILIGTNWNDEIGSMAGKAYIYLGKGSGWALNMNLSGADASWRGETTGDNAGVPVSSAGDVNGDRMADFMIGAGTNSDQALTLQGQTYLILGQKVGWAKNQSLSAAGASWLGEASFDYAPLALSGKGDINGDVLDDLLIGVNSHATPVGQIYLIFPVANKRALQVNKVELFMDAGFTKNAAYAALGDQIFIKMTAVDPDPAAVNYEQVKITSWPNDMFGFTLDIAESGANTGIYTGDFFVENYTQEDLRWIKALPISNVRVTSAKNSSAFDSVSVGGSLKIDSVTILPGGTSPTLYANKQSYSIRVNVSDSIGHDHLDFVNLSLPLDQGMTNYTWYHDSNTFWTRENAGYYTKLDGASFADSQWNRSTVTFRIFFNWTFPDEVYHTIKVTVGTKDKNYVSREVPDAYKVEKHLDFYGTLQTKSSTGKIIKEGSALAMGTNITFTSVTVVYKGTTNVYPANSEFDVVVIDDDKNVWVDPDSGGAFIYVSVEAPLYTDVLMNYTIDIWGVPPECVNRTLTTYFKIDGDQIAFANPSPSQNDWQANKRVNAKVNVSDTGGSYIKADTIEYRIKKNGGQWGAWTSAFLTGVFPSLEASALVDLNDGPLNQIQWRGTDVVGNLDYTGNKTTSSEYTIKVDTVAPTFSDMWPMTGESKTEDVKFGMKVTDPWSMVKGESIEFTISTDDQESWSDWKNANYNGSKPFLECQGNATFKNGSQNWVRWRVTDMLSNTNMSEPLKIVVNTTPPKPANRAPVLQAIADRTVNVGSTLVMNGAASDPDGDVLTFSLTEKPEGMVITPQGLLTFSPTKDQEGEQNVTMKVSDSLLDDTKSFKVTVVLLKPTITLTTPTALQGELKGKVVVQGTAQGGVQGISKVDYSVDGGAWVSATGTTDWNFVIDTKSLSDGAHKVSIRVTDGLGTSAAQDYDITVKNKKNGGNGTQDNTMLMIAVVVAVIAVVAVVAAVIMMRRKKGPSEQMSTTQEPPATGTAPPQETPPVQPQESPAAETAPPQEAPPVQPQEPPAAETAPPQEAPPVQPQGPPK